VRNILIIISVFFYSFALFGQQPDTSCYTAEVFCFLEDMESTWVLPPVFQPEEPKSLCYDGGSGEGQPNNPLYFGFVPNSNTVEFFINYISSTPTNGNSLGYQWAIFEGCNLGDPIYVVCDGDQITGSITISDDSFIPGVTYYLMIDGYEGAITTFGIDVLTGIPSYANPYEVQEPTYFSNEEDGYIAFGDTIEYCLNGHLTTTVHGSNNNTGYIWSSPDPSGNGDIIHPSNADTLFFDFTVSDSLYRLCTQAITQCDSSELACFYVNVTENPQDSLGTFRYCEADLGNCVTPPGWEGPQICKGGTYFHTVVDPVTGCTHDQVVKIIEDQVSIENKDTLICGIDPFYYNGDTITTDSFLHQYLFPGGSVNGCDSILNLRGRRAIFNGTLSDLTCLDDEQFGLEVLVNDIYPTDYESIIVEWFLDGVSIGTGMVNDLTLKISDKGTYSALVTITKYGQSCVFDLGEVEVDRFITADYTADVTAICVDDVITVTLDAFNISANYQWLSGDNIIEVFPGVYEISWDQAGIYDLSLQVDFDGCEVLSGITQIIVEDRLDQPQLVCAGSTNDSLYVDWDPVDCTSAYEVYLDGALIITTNIPGYDFGGLDNGREYEIMVIAISDCLCNSTSSTIYCETVACPQNVELFCDQLPVKICMEDMTDFDLSAYATGDTSGAFTWSGDIIDQNGHISASTTSAGAYPLTATYQIEACTYELTDTFTVHPPVEFDWFHEDISCFYNLDGSITLVPTQGATPFTMTVNGVETNSLDTFNLEPGNYSIILTDNNSCISTLNTEILLPERPDLSIIGDTFIERGLTYEYRLSLDNIDYDSVVWYAPGLDTILCTGICDEISFDPLFDQALCIDLFYDDGCQIDTCIQLTVNYETKVFIPNVFTPGNNDGLNDFFMIKTNVYKNLRVLNFSVFDRWGSQLFHKANQYINKQTDDNFGWDGTFNGQAVLPGVYIYYIEIEDENGERSIFTGDITLIR
jgi:gliding motility-associated-like protein